MGADKSKRNMSGEKMFQLCGCGRLQHRTAKANWPNGEAFEDVSSKRIGRKMARQQIKGRIQIRLRQTRCRRVLGRRS